MSSSPTLTVSIVNHSNRELLLRSLEALAQHPPSRHPMEVVVLDNASDDGSAAAVREAFPSVRVIEQRHRAGFAANHNAVIRATEGDYVLVLNDDAFVEAGALDALLDYIEADGRIGAVAPRILSASGATQETAWRFPTPATALRFALTLGQVAIVQSGGDEPGPVEAASGCALLLRRTALERVGGFDEGFFMYSEDLDLCRRLADAGYTVHLLPAARVVHHSQQSSAGAGERRVNEQWRSLRRYWGKHHRPLGAHVAALATGAGYAAMAAAAAVAQRLPERVRPARAVNWSPSSLWLNARNAFRRSPAPGLRELAEGWNADHAR